MNSFKKMTCLGLTLGTLLSIAAPAHAQFVSNSSAPIRATSDFAVSQDGKTVLSGAVDVRQGDVRVLADKMELFTDGGGSLSENGFSRAIAQGNFYYLTPTQEVRGERGVYTSEDDTFEISGGVILKQSDGSVVTGEKLYYNLQTEQARVVGTCKGRKCGSKGRVNILIKNTNGGTQQTS